MVSGGPPTDPPVDPPVLPPAPPSPTTNTITRDAEFSSRLSSCDPHGSWSASRAQPPQTPGCVQPVVPPFPRTAPLPRVGASRRRRVEVNVGFCCICDVDDLVLEDGGRAVLALDPSADPSKSTACSILRRCDFSTCQVADDILSFLCSTRRTSSLI